MQYWLSASCILFIPGQTNSQAVPVQIEPSAYILSGETPAIATNGQGDWVGMWRHHSPSDAGVDATDLLVGTLSEGDNGSEGQFLQTEADDGYSYRDRLRLASDDGDTWVAVYTTTERKGSVNRPKSRLYIRRSTDGGETWSKARTLRIRPRVSLANTYVPAIATDGDGNWLIAWVEGAFGAATTGLWVVSSSDNGETWSHARRILRPPFVEAYGNVDVEYSDGGWMLSLSASGGLGLKPQPEGRSEVRIRVLRTCLNAVLWEEVAFHRFTISSTARVYGNFDLAHCGGGRWAMAWWRGHGQPGTGLYCMNSIDAGTTWSEPVQLDGGSLTSGSVGSSGFPRIAADARGNAIILYVNENEDITLSPMLYYVASSDAGATWSTPQRVVTTDAGLWPEPCTDQLDNPDCIDLHDER